MGMVVVKLMGGLGNQMFQYAFGRALALRLGHALFLDMDFLLDRNERKDFVFRDFDLDVFHISSCNLFDSEAKRKFNFFPFFPFIKRKTQIVQETSFTYDSSLSNLLGGRIYLDGYWQSYRYFESVASIIRQEFKVKQVLTKEQEQLQLKIKTSTSVCVNFRRTDFVTIPSAIQTHGVPTMAYYDKALQELSEKIGDSLEIFVFSDDIAWCKEHFQSTHPTFFVEHSLHKGDRFAAYLQLMSSCKYFIIPNSTFAWWAAWLSDTPDKIVITPERWFVDESLQKQTSALFPEDWIRLNVK